MSARIMGNGASPVPQQQTKYTRSESTPSWPRVLPALPLAELPHLRFQYAIIDVPCAERTFEP